MRRKRLADVHASCNVHADARFLGDIWSSLIAGEVDPTAAYFAAGCTTESRVAVRFSFAGGIVESREKVKLPMGILIVAASVQMVNNASDGAPSWRRVELRMVLHDDGDSSFLSPMGMVLKLDIGAVPNSESRG